MTLSTSRFAYQDCYDILDTALERTQGCRVPQPSHEACTHLRMRLHQARKLDREQNMLTFENGHPMYGRSNYDKLVVRVKEDDDRPYVYVEWGGIDTSEIEPLGVPLLEGQKPTPAIAAPRQTFDIEGEFEEVKEKPQLQIPDLRRRV